MSRLPVVAVVGRPNIGKSTLVNRILRRRAAVVDEQPGVTRDRREFIAEWAGRTFLLIDTGGWEARPGEELTAGIREQAEAAMSAADVVVFVADARSAITDDDQGVARLLQRSTVPWIFAANKVDGPNQELDLEHLWGLGLGAPTPISALHGRGVGDFLDALVAKLPEASGEVEEETYPSLAIVGRPNVGKSTLLNKLLGTDRVIVTPQAGTTRDPIEEMVEIDGDRYRLIDTAGIRRRVKIKDDVEYYSVLRAHEVVTQADVVLLLIDALEGATHQEQRLAEEIASAGAAIVVLLNKWDAVDPEQREITEDSVADRLAFIGWAPVLRISALTGARTHRLGKAITTVIENRRRRVPTPDLNRKLRTWQDAHPPPVRKGRRARIVFAVQAATEPPTIVLFTRGGELGDDYLRYLENRLREEYDFMGTPIAFVSRSHARRSSGAVA